MKTMLLMVSFHFLETVLIRKRVHTYTLKERARVHELTFLWVLQILPLLLSPLAWELGAGDDDALRLFSSLLLSLKTK